jgi:hypothetical protein
MELALILAGILFLAWVCIDEIFTIYVAIRSQYQKHKLKKAEHKEKKIAAQRQAWKREVLTAFQAHGFDRNTALFSLHASDTFKGYEDLLNELANEVESELEKENHEL